MSEIASSVGDINEKLKALVFSVLCIEHKVLFE